MRTAVVLCVTLGLALTALLVTGAFRPSPSSSIAGTETSRTGETAKLPNGTLVVGKRAGKRAAALYVTPSSRSEVSVRTILIGPDGLGADGLTVSFSQTDGGEVPGEPCGVGCYRAARPLSAGVPIVVLVGEGGTQTSVRFDVPATWEPAAIVAKRLTSAFRNLESVVYDERLATGLGREINTRWVMEAPNRLSYVIRRGRRGIVVGNRRWDKARGGPWVRSGTTPLRVPEPPWGTKIELASLVGEARVGDRPTSIVTFQSKGQPVAWFTVWVDEETSLPLRLRMTTAAHFMTQRFIAFDSGARVEAPAP